MELLNEIVLLVMAGSVDLEDGEMGIIKCCEYYCLQHGLSQDYAYEAAKRLYREGAIEAGIPVAVVDGKAKLRDFFSEEYINEQSGNTGTTDGE